MPGNKSDRGIFTHVEIAESSVSNLTDLERLGIH